MYTIKLLVSSLFILSSFLFSNCVDGTDICLSLDGGNLNLNGRVIDTIYDGFIGSGYYIKNWDAVEFSSGIYIIQMNINGFYDTQKVILIK